MALPRGVDDFIRSDGRCVLSGSRIGKTTRGHPFRIAAVWTAAGRQLSLVDPLFQAVPLFVLIPLAGSLMDSHLGNRQPLLSYFKNSGVPDASLFAMGRGCRLFKFWHLSLELKPQLSPMHKKKA